MVKPDPKIIKRFTLMSEELYKDFLKYCDGESESAAIRDAIIFKIEYEKLREEKQKNDTFQQGNNTNAERYERGEISGE